MGITETLAWINRTADLQQKQDILENRIAALKKIQEQQDKRLDSLEEARKAPVYDYHYNGG